MKKSSLTQTQTVLAGLGLLLGLDFFMFAGVFFGGDHDVVGNHTTDLFAQFMAWREFGFSQLSSGNFALWNPHIFSGTPFFGGFQSALLYPPNWLFLILPLNTAVNWSIALNVFLIGAFTYLWVFRRRLHPAACFLAGALIMFSGTYFLHIYAGHLPNLCTMVWTPLLFLAIDGIFEEPGDPRLDPVPAPTPGKKKAAKQAAAKIALKPIHRFVWTLIGIFAVAMQIFAGHPQYFYYTGIAASIYCILRLIWSRRIGRALGWLLLMPAGGLALAAVQLMAGIDAAQQTVRSNAVTWEFASAFSFPPENFLTSLAPWFFGDMSDQMPYWGRCYLWEMSIFFSVTGLVLALYAVLYAERKRRTFAVTLCVILFALALGYHTPLLEILYNYFPGYNKFRGTSKFTFQASLFLVLLAAIGLDRIIALRRVEKRFIWGVAAAALLLFGWAIWIRGEPTAVWMHFGKGIEKTQEAYVSKDAYNNVAFAELTQAQASNSLLWAAATVGIIAILLALCSAFEYAVFGLIALAVIELFSFGLHRRDTFDSRTTVIPQLKQFVAAHPGDYRIINSLNPNSAMQFGALDMWGFDPGVLRRYAEFMFYTQGHKPDQAEQYLDFKRIDPLYILTRCKYLFLSKGGELAVDEAVNPPMQHLELMQEYRVIPTRDSIFAAMKSPDFQPRKEVILEAEPSIKPEVSDQAGTVHIDHETTDTLTIEADLPHPEILLITDPYCEGWRAVALPGSAQSSYDVLPADYIIRAVPLAAGHHHFRVEYMPRAYRIGKWISILSLLTYSIGAWFAVGMLRRKPSL